MAVIIPESQHINHSRWENWIDFSLTCIVLCLKPLAVARHILRLLVLLVLVRLEHVVEELELRDAWEDAAEEEGEEESEGLHFRWSDVSVAVLRIRVLLSRMSWAFCERRKCEFGALLYRDSRGQRGEVLLTSRSRT